MADPDEGNRTSPREQVVKNIPRRIGLMTGDCIPEIRSLMPELAETIVGLVFRQHAPASMPDEASLNRSIPDISRGRVPGRGRRQRKLPRVSVLR